MHIYSMSLFCTLITLHNFFCHLMQVQQIGRPNFREISQSAFSGRPLARDDWKGWWAIVMHFDDRPTGD